MPEVKRRHEAKVKAGTVSPDDEEEFQALLAKVAEWERSREAWRTPRIAPPVGDQTESNSIKPNQTRAKRLFCLFITPLIDTTADMRGIFATNPRIRPKKCVFKGAMTGPKSR
jgi:hypothetical protein